MIFRFRLCRALCASILFAALPLLHGAEPALTQTDVFISGQGGYHTYRIPAVIRPGNGDLLAFCEGRKSGGGDTGDIDIVLKRSADGGRTWGPLAVVWNDDANTCGNPCPVVDRATGTVWLLLTHNLGTDHERDIAAHRSQGTRTVWVLSSQDNGVTWTAPRDITSTTKDPSWTWYATGPGIGIQLERGPHAGRLVVPCDHNRDDAAEPDRHVTESHVIFSDDHGATWHLGGSTAARMNECQVAERFDGEGTLLLSMRSNSGRHRRAQAVSRDGGATWSAPVDVDDLVDPVCQASLLRDDRRRLLYFSNPAAETRRALTVKSSADGGATWQPLAVPHGGPAAYSCLVLPDADTLGCLYENGATKPYDRITFARLPLPGAEAPASGPKRP